MCDRSFGWVRKKLNLCDCTTRLKLSATWLFLKEIFSLCSVRQVAKSCNHQVKDKPLSQHAPLRKQPVDDTASLAKRIWTGGHAKHGNLTLIILFHPNSWVRHKSVVGLRLNLRADRSQDRYRKWLPWIVNSNPPSSNVNTLLALGITAK